jgi:hypothetical protein
MTSRIERRSNMSDVLSVIFDRWDRHPNIHEYGEAIDRRIDRLVGGSDQVRRVGPDPQVPIKGFAAKLELHETGPIFLLDPSNLPTLTPLLNDVRAMALDWAKRSTGGEQKVLRVKIRYGPEASKPGVTDEYYSWERVKVTTDPLTLAKHLDELIEFILRMGSS